MKLIFSSLFLAMLCALAYTDAADVLYTDKYDSFDVDVVLNNKRLLTNYINCLLDKGKCTKEGAELKTHLGDALETECSKCTPKQQEKGKRVLKYLYENEKDYFKQLEAKYDPDGKYRKRYEKEAKKEGINL